MYLPYGNWNIFENDKQVAATIISENNAISLVYVNAEGKSTSKQVSVTITDKEKKVITGDKVAIFKIFKASDTEFAEPIKLYKINGEGTETDEFDQFKMDEDGSIQMAGNLENGDYVLKETTAPAGYKLNDNPVPFTVKKEVAAHTITIAHVKATQEEAQGNTQVAEKVTEVAEKANQILEKVRESQEGAEKLKEQVAKFKV